MESCAIYSHLVNDKTVLELIERNFPSPFYHIKVDKMNNCWTSIQITNEKNDTILRFKKRMKILFDYKLAEPTDDITRNLLGMYNFFQTIPAQKTDIQERLLYKIASINVELGIVGSPTFLENGLQKKTILEITKLLDGIIFSGSNSIFNFGKAKNGMLDKDGNLILDQLGKSNIMNLEVYVEDKYFI